jgi:hypothetical protein
VLIICENILFYTQLIHNITIRKKKMATTKTAKKPAAKKPAAKKAAKK